MPFDFDTSDAGTEAAVDNIFEQLNPAAPEPAENLDAQLSEVERRLEKAQYYRALLTESIFEGDDGETAVAVVEEIREFIRGRLAVLLGVAVEAPKSQPQFDDDEVQILKKVCAKLLRKPQLMEGAPKSPPALKKVDGPRAPTVSKTKVPEKPAVKKHPAKAPAQAPKKSKLQPTGEVLTIEHVVKDKDGERTVSTQYRKFVDPNLGDVFVDGDGKRYLLTTNDDGRKFMKSVSAQARPVGVKPLPPLNPSQIQMVSQQQAAEITGRMEAGLSALVQTAIRTPAKE